jgi:AcrR family transcriptional regulator
MPKRAAKTDTKATKRPASKANGKKRNGRMSAIDREELILDAAVDVFHEKGFSDASVDDVANAVGILKGSLYYYIDSKDDLLERVLDAVHREVEELIAAKLERADGTPLEKLADYIRAQVEYNARNIKRVRVYYKDYERLSPDRLASLRSKRRGNEQVMIATIEAAKEAGELDAGLDERLAAKSVFALIIWMHTWYRRGGGYSGAALGEFCANFALFGLHTSPAAGPPKRKTSSSKRSA